MKLKEFHVKNFRSLKEVSLTNIGELSVFIGANSSGKTNILDAMRLFFNEFDQAPQRNIGAINDYIWFERRPDSPVELRAVFEALENELVLLLPMEIFTIQSQLTKDEEQSKPGLLKNTNRLEIIRQIAGPVSSASWITKSVTLNGESLVDFEELVPPVGGPKKAKEPKKMLRVDGPFPTLEAATYTLPGVAAGETLSVLDDSTGQTTPLTRGSDGVYRGTELFDSSMFQTLNYHLAFPGGATGEFTHALTSDETAAGVVSLSIKHPTFMIVEPSQGSVKIGTSISLVAGVGDQVPGGAMPTGTVTWSDHNAGGSFSNGGACTLFSFIGSICRIFYSPPAGPVPVAITAVYFGDSLHTGATANSYLSVTLRTTTTNIGCSPGIVPVNAPTSCTAIVTDNDFGTPLTPTGTVRFGTSSAGSFTPSPMCGLSGSSTTVAHCSVMYTPSLGSEGTHTINGIYLQNPLSGNIVHMGSGDSFSLIVTQRSVSTSVTCVTNPGFLSGTVTCTAIVIDTSPGSTVTPTGTVFFGSFGSGVFSAPRCTLSGGSCFVTYTAGSVGVQTILAKYGGDTDHAGGASGTFALSVIYDFSGISLPPPRHDGTYHLGLALHVSFQLTDANGNFVSTARALIFVDTNPGTPAGMSNMSNLFGYDQATNTYLYNLSTGALTVGSHTITVTLDDGTSHSAVIILATH